MTEPDIATTEARQILEEISAVAAERRDEVQPALDRPLPPWLLEIFQTEVVYTLNAQQWRLRSASFPTLSQLLREKFAVTFARPSMAPLTMGDGVSDDALGSVMIRSDEMLRFEDGKFMRTASDFDVIRSININFESVHVVVQGVSEIAELIAADVAEMVAAAAGAQRRWDQIRAGTQLIGYATATIVDLGVPFEQVLAASLQDFTKSQMLSGRKFAYDSARRSSRHGFERSPDLTVSWGLEEVQLKFSIFDTRTGRWEETQFNLRVRARDEMGTGRVRAYSELPFQKHMECMTALRLALGAA